MLDNYFVYETPDFLNLEYVQNLVLTELKANTVLQGYIRIDVTSDSYLNQVREQFPFLGTWLNIYYTRPTGYIPLHIDGHRLVAFNIPISGCDETSQTIWYEPVTEWTKIYKPDERHYRVGGDMREVYRFALVRPALIRNDVAHDVRRFNASETRIIASWGCGGTYEECRQAFKEILEKQLLTKF